ncbi:efflux RND transporter periplasmic adaptor subunit [Methyloligella solikamskensis]|uniref:Efflux RND transporter periplasmic adaptor subunit n=1 Tax=Methyloligella solikamskensis TaxID=1177756 RepID=A0ABW3JD81_9HYPH
MLHSLLRLLLTVAVLFAVPVLVGSVFVGPVLAHEGHVHDEPKPLMVPVAPRVVAMTPQFELVGVLSAPGELIVFLSTFDTSAPVTGASLSVSGDGGVVEAKSDSEGVFVAEAPWLTASPPADLIFSLALEDGRQDLLTGQLAPSGEEAAENEPGGTGLAEGFSVFSVLVLAVLAFVAGVVATSFFRQNEEASGEPEDASAADTKVEREEKKPSRVTTLRRSAGVILLCIGAVAFPRAEAFAVEEPIDALPALPAGMAMDQPQRLSDGSIFFPKPTQHLLSLRTEIVTEQKIARTRELSGLVTVPLGNRGRVQASRPGRFEPADGDIYVGMEVKKGQILGHIDAYIEAADRANLRSQIAETEARIEKNRTILGRFESIPNAVPKVKVDEVRGELQALIERRKELVPGLTVKEPLVAPIDGIVSIADVAAGQMVEARDTLFEIVDPSALRIEAVASESGPIGKIRSATAVIEGFEPLKLKYLGQGPALKQHSRLLTFQIVQPGQDLAAGMTAHVILTLGEERRGVAVPSSAVTRDAAGLPAVWVKTAPEVFQSRVVNTMPLDGEHLLITAGLRPKDRIVTSGANLLSQVR